MVLLKIQQTNPDLSWGFTNRLDYVEYNLSLFGKAYENHIYDLLEATDFCLIHFIKAGKYIVYLKISKDRSISIMEFDEIFLENDSLSVASITRRYYERDGKNFNHHEMWFKIEEIKRSYLENQNSVVLILAP